MEKIHQNINELIGGTPLVKLNRLTDGCGAEVVVKCEFFNPGSSLKDRIALNMIETAEKNGDLSEGATIIEPTSGNTGIGLALVAAVKGYRIILTMPESMSVERRKMLQALGAELVLTPAFEGMQGAIDQAEILRKQIKQSFMPQQFKNPANPEAHYRTTGEEIWRDTDGNIDILVAGIGTGGTISGAGGCLREKKPDLRIVAVEPAESPVLSGGAAGPHMIQGIGAGFVPDVLRRELIDEIITVSSTNAIETAKRLISQEGIITGISSGANAWAALKIARRPENKGKRIVTIMCDTGERYISTLLFYQD